MIDNLVRITKQITFGDIRSKKYSKIDVYEEQMIEWLFKPIKQLSENKSNFEFGYAMFALELLFFEPHGKYLSGNTNDGSAKSFGKGFDPFILFLKSEKLITDETYNLIQNVKFYNISRCGIYHSLTLKSGLLIDSVQLEKTKVFYTSNIYSGILVSPWNLLAALERYFNNYVANVRNLEDNEKVSKFNETFDTLFVYE